MLCGIVNFKFVDFPENFGAYRACPGNGMTSGDRMVEVGAGTVEIVEAGTEDGCPLICERNLPVTLCNSSTKLISMLDKSPIESLGT